METQNVINEILALTGLIDALNRVRDVDAMNIAITKVTELIEKL